MSTEVKYSEAVYRLTNKGIVARFGQDTLPPTTYQNLKNLEVRQENAVSLRFGRIPLTVSGGNSAPLATPIMQLGRLKGLFGTTWRYASGGGILYRIAGDAPGLWSNIANGLSVANRPTMISYTPVFSGTPYIFIADLNVMLKDDGTGTPASWGFTWPPYPLTSAVVDYLGYVYYDPTLFTIVGGSAALFSVYSENGVVKVVATDSLVTIVLPNVTGLEVGETLRIFLTFESLFVSIQYIDQSNNLVLVLNQNFALCVVGWTLPVAVETVRITTAGGTVTITPNTPFSSAQDWMPLTNGSQIPTVDLRVNVADPTKITSIEVDVSTGDGTFTNYFSSITPGALFQTNVLSTIKIPENDLNFTSHGTPDWHKVYSVRIIITSTGATTVDLYSCQNNLNAEQTILGGIDYDWRFTYWDENTGAESNPSSEMLVGSIYGLYNPLGMFNLPVRLQRLNITLPGVTHWNVYRRGGTLANGWNMIAQIPITVFFFFDIVSDAQASEGNLLSIDKFPPITSTLPVSVNTTLTAALIPLLPTNTISVFVASMANVSVNQLLTIGQGQTQEVVTVVAIASDHFVTYIELPHDIGEQVYGDSAYDQPCNIAIVAFQRAWLAGDVNNPGRLYYSNVDAIEEFGVENFIDLGNLTDPIKGMLFENGVLNVWTLSTIWMIYAVSGSQPNDQSTDSNHGMFSTLCIVKAEGVSFYYSDDGIYVYSGGRAIEVSQFLQWIFREYDENTNGPIPVMDLTKRELANMGRYRDEIFFSYPPKIT